MSKQFQIGDLVRFSSSHALGIIVDLRPIRTYMPFEAFASEGRYDENFKEAKVFWIDPGGETFWCCDVTLELISRASFRKED